MSDPDEYASVCEESKGDVARVIEDILNVAGFYCRMSIRVYCKDRYMYADVFPNPFKSCDPFCDELCASSRFYVFRHEVKYIGRRLVAERPIIVNSALISIGLVRDGKIDYVPLMAIHGARDVVGDLMDLDVLMLRLELYRLPLDALSPAVRNIPGLEG